MSEMFEIGDTIANMTLAEVAQLRDYLKDKHGLDPCPKPPPFQESNTQEEIAPVKTSFTVVLENLVDDTKKFAVIKCIREILALSLADANNFVKILPKEVKIDIQNFEAKEIASKLEAAGAKITIK